MTTSELSPLFNNRKLKTTDIDLATDKVQFLTNEKIRVFSPEEQKKINQA
jgi:hypothetical protein